MAVDQGRAPRHDGFVPVSEQLREIFGHTTQMEISSHLKSNGLEEGSQTTVSAWLRGARQPTNDQIAKIEDIYDIERGTILVRAGYVSPAAKKRAPTQPADDIGRVLDLARKIEVGLKKSQSRDAKLSDIITLCEKLARNQSAVAARLDRIDEKLADLAAHISAFPR